jgi:hypothetical protein
MLDAADTRKAVDEIKRQAELASDYSTNRGQVSRNFCKRTGVKAAVLSKAVALDKMDDLKRQSFYRDLFSLGKALGHFDQLDAFDDLRGMFRDLAEGGAPADAGEGDQAGHESTLDGEADDTPPTGADGKVELAQDPAAAAGRRRRPRSPAAEAAKDNGIGEGGADNGAGRLRNLKLVGA